MLYKYSLNLSRLKETNFKKIKFFLNKISKAWKMPQKPTEVIKLTNF